MAEHPRLHQLPRRRSPRAVFSGQYVGNRMKLVIHIIDYDMKSNDIIMMMIQALGPVKDKCREIRWIDNSGQVIVVIGCEKKIKRKVKRKK